MTPTRCASVEASSKSWVTSTVGSPSVSSSSRSSARTLVLVCASSAESGSSRRSTCGSRASARASATRWRSPPESSVTRARARWAIRKRSSMASACVPVTCAEAHVADHVEVREQRVLLEEVADAPALRRDVDSSGRVEERDAVECHDAVLRAHQPGDDAQHGRLPRTGRPDESKGVPLLHRQVCACLEGPKRMGELDAERHRVVSLTDRRTVALMTMRSALIARATVNSTSNCS